MAATKMKHILVLFVILVLMKNLELQFASAKSVGNVVEEGSPSISRVLEEVLENKKANLQVEDRACSKNGGGCWMDTTHCCTGVCVFFVCAGDKSKSTIKHNAILSIINKNQLKIIDLIENNDYILFKL